MDETPINNKKNNKNRGVCFKIEEIEDNNQN